MTSCNVQRVWVREDYPSRCRATWCCCGVFIPRRGNSSKLRITSCNNKTSNYHTWICWVIIDAPLPLLIAIAISKSWKTKLIVKANFPIIDCEALISDPWFQEWNASVASTVRVTCYTVEGVDRSYSGDLKVAANPECNVPILLIHECELMTPEYGGLRFRRLNYLEVDTRRVNVIQWPIELNISIWC